MNGKKPQTPRPAPPPQQAGEEDTCQPLPSSPSWHNPHPKSPEGPLFPDKDTNPDHRLSLPPACQPGFTCPFHRCDLRAKPPSWIGPGTGSRGVGLSGATSNTHLLTALREPLARPAWARSSHTTAQHSTGTSTLYTAGWGRDTAQPGLSGGLAWGPQCWSDALNPNPTEPGFPGSTAKVLGKDPLQAPGPAAGETQALLKQAPGRAKTRPCLQGHPSLRCYLSALPAPS